MTRVFTSDYRDHGQGRPDPFPVHKLRRVDRPTTRIREDQIQRVDERDGGFRRGARGEYGPFIQQEYGRFMEKSPLAHALLNMTHALQPLVDGPVCGSRASWLDDPSANARHVKETAYFLRADLVGICELPPYAVFTHNRWDGSPVECGHKYAVAILVDQDWKTADAFDGHDWMSNAMSFLGYSNSGFIACVLADYLRNMGFPARAHHAMNYQVVVPPILLWAGLGEMSRMGDVVLNPFLGPRFKAAVVTTDFPLAIDKPIDFGLQDFCSKCKKCARECPSGAISDGGKVLHNGYEKWPLDVKKCTSMRVGNQRGSGCGTCIKVCPWNKPNTPLHRLTNWAMREIPPLRNFAVAGDDWLGYGQPDARRKWWFDLEEKNGVLRIPRPSSEGEKAVCDREVE